MAQQLIIGTFRLPAQGLNAARDAMQAMVTASRAEDGCLMYAYAEDVLQPGLIRVTELWRDQAALDRLFATPHLAQWRASWAALGIDERALTAYAVSGAQPT